MRDRLIEDLKGFRTPICEGLNAKLPYAEELADYLLSSGVIKELTEGIKARDDTISRFIETMPLVKADTVKKMRELLTTFFDIDDMLKYNEVDADYINEQINRIAEEMIKGD